MHDLVEATAARPIFRPRSNKYQWLIVLALFMSGMMIYGVGLYGFTLLIPPLSHDFGWSRAATGGLVSMFWLAAPLTLLGGYGTRRFGANRLICGAILLEAACMAAVGLISSLSELYLLRALMGAGKIMMMAGVTAQASNWFKRRFGFAVAICYSGWHFGGLIIAPATQALISNYGWRNACFILSAAIIVLALPPMLIWGRAEFPYQVGLTPDGGLPPITAGSAIAPSRPDDRAGYLEALKDGGFWMVVLITIFGGFPYGAMLTHEVALLRGTGIAPDMAAGALGATAGMAIVGALGVGYLCDRFAFKRVMTGELILMLVAVAGFLSILSHASTISLFLAAAGFGLAVGGFDTAIIAGLQKRYGETSFNSVFGVWYFLYLMVLLLGPIEAGHLFDISGSYRTAIEAMIGCIMLALFTSVILPATSRKPRRAAAGKQR